MLRGDRCHYARLLVTTAVFAVALAAAPRNASADWTVTPFVGWNFGGSADVNNPAAGTNFNNSFDQKIDYGVSIAGMGHGILEESSIRVLAEFLRDQCGHQRDPVRKR